MAKTSVDMLVPSLKGVPKFKGKVRHLEDFFAVFEAAATDCTVMDGDKAKTALKYVKKSRDRELWRSMEGYEGTGVTYTKWKEAVMCMYAPQEKKQQARFTQLQEFIHENEYDCISSENELMMYYCKYILIVSPLVSNGTITNSQQNLYFWQGLHPKTRKELLAQITNTCQPEDIPAIMDVLKAGQHIYQKNVFDQRYTGRLKRLLYDCCKSSESSSDSSSSLSSSSDDDSKSSGSEDGWDSGVEQRKRRERRRREKRKRGQGGIGLKESKSKRERRRMK
jgi:hypothetical protein